MEKAFLQCSHITKRYPDFSLEDINFSLESGYIMGIIGRNGSGKTTLLRSLLDCISVEGEWFLEGNTKGGDMVSFKKKIAYILNETPFPEEMQAGECGIYYGRWYPGFDRKRYFSLLKEYGISEKQTIQKLSQGQKIRQQLAFALSYDAKLYVMDEPDGNLDVKFRETFYEDVRKLIVSGEKSVLYASHLVEEMEVFADYILWLSDGKVKTLGSMEELRERYCILEESEEVLRTELGKGWWEAHKVGGLVNEHHQEFLVDFGSLDSAERKAILEKTKGSMRHPKLKEIMYFVEKRDAVLCGSGIKGGERL